MLTVLPADVRVIQVYIFARCNFDRKKDDENWEIEKGVQAGNNYKPIVFVVRHIPITRQEFVHLFAMSKERPKC